MVEIVAETAAAIEDRVAIVDLDVEDLAADAVDAAAVVEEDRADREGN